MECPFCNIDSQKLRIIEQTEDYLVILSNPRLIPGHTLVIPRRHVEMPWDLFKEERKIVFDTVLRYQQKIIDSFSSGCDVRQNYRPFIPQGKIKVNHVHYHLLPRELEDEYFQKCQVAEKDLWENLGREELDRFTNMFKD